MSKTFTQEAVDKLLEKQIANAEKAVAAATKAETKRVLEILKQVTADNKEVSSKEIKTHVALLLKEISASIKEAA